MINVVVKYTEVGVIAETGIISDNLERTKTIDCSSVKAQPTMLDVTNSRGENCSFFYDKITELSIDGSAVAAPITLEKVVAALVPAQSQNSNGGQE